MQTFPLELDNALFIFNLDQYIPNWYPVNFFFINCIPFELTFLLNWFTYFFLDILQFQLFGTMILLLWFLIFKLLSIFKPNDFFIFSLSSDLNFLTKFSGIYFFIFAHSDIQFLLSSSLLYIVWLSTKVLLFLSHISFILNISKSTFYRCCLPTNRVNTN